MNKDYRLDLLNYLKTNRLLINEVNELLNNNKYKIDEDFKEFMNKLQKMRLDDYDLDTDYDLTNYVMDAIHTLYSSNELKDANEKLADEIAQLRIHLAKAEELATKYGLTFNINPAHGMGGNFDAGVWIPSSQRC